MKTNTGHTFLVIFLEIFKDGCELSLYITTSSVNPVHVSIIVPLRPDLGPLASMEVSSMSPGMVDILPELSANGTGKNDHGILVSSSGDIAVQAYSRTLPSTGLNSTGAFMAMPMQSLGTEYMVLTYCEINYCQFAVTSLEDTAVELDLKISREASFTYKGVSYKDGDVLTVDLKAFQVFQVQTTGDLSGTIIKSSPGKLAVVVGSTHTTVASFVQTTERDYLVEQLPPLNTIGWSYVIVPFPGRTTGDVVVLLAVEKDCNLTSSLFPLELKYRQPSAIVIYHAGYGRMESNGRFMIAHITSSPEVSNNNTDASMYFVPPIAQWRGANTTIAAITPVTVMIYGSAACMGTLVVSGSVLPASEWTPHYYAQYAHTTLDLTTNGAVLESNTAECAELAGYIYGTSWMTAFSLSTGSYFRELFPPHKESSSSTMDYVSTTLLLPEVTESTVTSVEASYTTSTSVLSTTSLSPVTPAPPTQLVIGTEPPLPTQPPTVTTQTPQTPPLTQPPTQLTSSSSSSPLSSTLTLNTSDTTSSTTARARYLCMCRCSRPHRELKTEVAHIKQRLTLNASGLSKALRRKSSIPDERRSAVAIGTSATVFLVLSVCVMVATDVFAVIVHVVRIFM